MAIKQHSSATGDLSLVSYDDKRGYHAPLSRVERLQGLEVEHRTKSMYRRYDKLKEKPIAYEIMDDIFIDRHVFGAVGVMAEKPVHFKTTMSRRRLYLIDRNRVELARTLDSSRQQRLYALRGVLEHLIITAGPHTAWNRQIAVATKEELRANPLSCPTLYVTVPCTSEELHLITALMPRGSKVIIFDGEGDSVEG